MSALQQIPLIFQENIQRTNQINAWNAVTPQRMNTWKHKILWYIGTHPNSTYDEIYEGLKTFCEKENMGLVKLPTVVGRLSDWSHISPIYLEVTGSRDGKAMYILSDEGIKYLEGKI